MKKQLAGATIVGLLVVGLALPAGAHNFQGEGDCEVFTNHSGHIPGSYDYAEFYEDGQLVTTVETNGEDTFVNPAGFDAGESWDQVNKCHNGEEPPPPPTVTVDCLTLTIDAAEGQIVGVQIGDGFVEIEGSDSFTGQPGQAWAVYWNDQVIASGVFEECSTTTTTTIPATTTTEAPTTTTVPESTTVPEITTTVPEVTTTTTSPPPELPFTGIDRGQLIALGSSALALGALLVFGMKREEEADA